MECQYSLLAEILFLGEFVPLGRRALWDGVVEGERHKRATRGPIAETEMSRAGMNQGRLPEVKRACSHTKSGEG